LLTGYNILVAEDNPLNQKIAVFLLTKHGARVVTAVNGVDAIKKLQEDSFDIVLMDLQMPEMDGFEATQYIRNTLKSNIPVLALSASNYEDEIEKCLKAGMNGCIAKPIDADMLYNTIKKLAGEQQITA
jgi:CheY-like chemotaxis protein